MDIHERNDLYYRACAWAEHDFPAVCRRICDLTGGYIQIGHESGAYCRSIEDVVALLDELPESGMRACKCGQAVLTASAECLFYESANLTSFLDWCCKTYSLEWEVEDPNGPLHDTYYRMWAGAYDDPIIRVRLASDRAKLVAPLIALAELDPRWIYDYLVYNNVLKELNPKGTFDLPAKFREARYARHGWPAVKAWRAAQKAEVEAKGARPG